MRILFLVMMSCSVARAAEPPIVVLGPEQSQLDLNRSNGGLPLARGVTSTQVLRACRVAPELSDGKGWTYHHHLDLGCWKGRLYLAWNSCEKDEDVWPSRELYSTSSDGVNWMAPAELFPQGTSTAARMYWFHAPNGRMLAIAGYRSTQENLPERKKGSLVVREIKGDHTLGTVYMLRPPTNAGEPAPLDFTAASDPGFVEACRQLLANKPFLEQADYGYLLSEQERIKWHDINAWPADEPSKAHFPNRFGKAMAFYHRKDGALVSVMKWGWVMVSTDEGKTWSSPVRPESLVAGMAKVWGQRTADGRYALVYNPHLEHRYPLVAVSGDDGVTFSNMRVIQGEVPPIRYPGLYKVVGPQYVRGISEWSSDGSWTDDGAMWLCYSMGKEDIWVSRVALPMDGRAKINEAKGWSTYSPKWAPVTIASENGATVLTLEDRDPADYARAVHTFESPQARVDLSFDLMLEESASAPLYIDLIGPRQTQIARISTEGWEVGKWLPIRLELDCPKKAGAVAVDGQRKEIGAAFAPGVDAIVAISFTTGERPKDAITPEQDRPIAPTKYRIRFR